MRVVAVLLLLTLGVGLGARRVTSVDPMQTVDARAHSIRSEDGALLAAFEFDGPARLVWVRPRTLRPVSRPLALREDFVSDYALSPDGGRLAVGSEMHSRIEFFDLRRWRSLGSMVLGDGSGGASGLVWATERRLLALAGSPYERARPVVVDPGRRRVVHRSRWSGRAIRWEAAGKRLIFLAAGYGGSVARHARLLSFDAHGRLRKLDLSRIEAGTWRTGRRRWRNVEPGLAVTPSGRRAYVLSADGQVAADVDLRAWRLAYHPLLEARSPWRRAAELIEPAAHAKEPFDSALRTAHVLPGGAIAVTGEDQDATSHKLDTIPYGVRLIDPDSWTWRSVDQDAQEVTVAGGLLLARRWSCSCANGLPPIGVRAYDSAGELRFTRFANNKGAIVLGSADGHAYMQIKRGKTRRIHVIELDSGNTVRVLPQRDLRLLAP